MGKNAFFVFIVYGRKLPITVFVKFLKVPTAGFAVNHYLSKESFLLTQIQAVERFPAISLKPMGFAKARSVIRAVAPIECAIC